MKRLAALLLLISLAPSAHAQVLLEITEAKMSYDCANLASFQAALDSLPLARVDHWIGGLAGFVANLYNYDRYQSASRTDVPNTGDLQHMDAARARIHTDFRQSIEGYYGGGILSLVDLAHLAWNMSTGKKSDPSEFFTPEIYGPDQAKTLAFLKSHPACRQDLLELSQILRGDSANLTSTGIRPRKSAGSNPKAEVSLPTVSGGGW